MTRRLIALAAACVLGWWAVAVALGWATLRDALAVAAVAAWTGGAAYAGWWVARRGEADRFNGKLDAALLLRRIAERQRLYDALRAQRAEIEAKYAADTEAVNDAIKEGR